MTIHAVPFQTTSPKKSTTQIFKPRVEGFSITGTGYHNDQGTLDMKTQRVKDKQEIKEWFRIKNV
jgi:hypothetical protein